MGFLVKVCLWKELLVLVRVSEWEKKRSLSSIGRKVCLGAAGCG